MPSYPYLDHAGMRERFHGTLKASAFPPELLHIVALTQEVSNESEVTLIY